MQQPVSSVRISKQLTEKLENNGYKYVEDVFASKKQWIKDAADEIKANIINVKFKSALDNWQFERSNASIPTMSQSLDAALGHGVKLGTITEICGLPGNGKTQLCLQLCVTVQIPKIYGGLEAQALYIDTATNFVPSRLKDMIHGCRKQLETAKDKANVDLDQWEDKTLFGVHMAEAFGIESFTSAINLLDDLIDQNPKIKLIVIDNVAFPFKNECSEIDRTGILYRTVAKLRKIASENNIAVVLTNEMSTRIGFGIVGALGDAWAHCAGAKIILALPNVAVTHRSDKRDAVAKIQITPGGIRDVG